MFCLWNIPDIVVQDPLVNIAPDNTFPVFHPLDLVGDIQILSSVWFNDRVLVFRLRRQLDRLGFVSEKLLSQLLCLVKVRDGKTHHVANAPDLLP